MQLLTALGERLLLVYVHTHACRVRSSTAVPLSPYRGQCLLIANRRSQPTGVVGQATYTIVLRGLRLCWPPTGSASETGVLPPGAGAGDMSRALLLSTESSRSAKEDPGGGRGCSRC